MYGYDVDVDRFRALPPWRDPDFYIALAATVLALAPTDVRDWIAAHPLAVAPIVAYLLAKGYVRGEGAKALGIAVGGSRVTDVVDTQTQSHASDTGASA